MRKYFLVILFFVAAGLVAAEPVKKNAEPATRAVAPQPENLSVQLLNTVKAAHEKVQKKLDCAAELKAITDAKKTVETARLKAAAEFTKQQAGLEARKADKTALEALETQRKAVNARFNELIRLIDQVEKNQKTALLPEKLNDLIVFLEPAASAAAEKEAAKAPTEPLSRGAAPKPEAAPVKK